MGYSALAAAAAAAALAGAPNVVAERWAEMPELVEKVMRDGEGAVIDGVLATSLNVDEPTTCKIFHFGEGADKLSHSVYVALHPGTKPGEIKPQFAFLVARRLSTRIQERRFLRASVSGRLEQVTVIRERLDSKGVPLPDGREVSGVGVGHEKARAWFEHESDFYFKGKHRRSRR